MDVGGEEGVGGGVGGGGEGDVAARYERDLVHKLKLLRHELSLQQPQAGHCRIEVSREEIFEVGAILQHFQCRFLRLSICGWSKSMRLIQQRPQPILSGFLL